MTIDNKSNNLLDDSTIDMLKLSNKLELDLGLVLNSKLELWVAATPPVDHYRQLYEY